MQTTLNWRWSAVGLVAVAIAMSPLAFTRRAPDHGVDAPANLSFTLKDMDGHDVQLSSFRGHPILINFWATWCGPCRQEIPGYADLQRKYGKDGLVIIGVSLDSDEHASDTVKTFVQKFGVDYQVVMGDDAVQTAFGGMDAIPTTFLIDRAGQLRDHKVGAEPTKEYEKKVTALLAEPTKEPERKVAALLN